ncbi:DUF596 domain-containing protein [Serratia marcescens]|uniref:DUF596 domain-containing protein n=1 Tax=Serratia marcescens TaxID=615 RepID=UPI001D13EE53|nr:DUF596 domain-containing protein [Serratia marcescens]
MKLLIPDSLYEERAYTLEGMAIDALWRVSCPNEDIRNDAFPFEEKKEYFFAFLQRLLEDGKIKLANNDKFLEGSIAEQIALYREKFPKNQEEMDADAFDGFWFLTEKCPGGIVWIHESGYEDWT